MAPLENFLTDKEKARARKRMKILRLLKNGLTVREVAKRLEVSTATVIKTKKCFTKRKQKKEPGENMDLSSKTARRWVWG